MKHPELPHHPLRGHPEIMNPPSRVPSRNSLKAKGMNLEEAEHASIAERQDTWPVPALTENPEQQHEQLLPLCTTSTI
jgi:hypothetical protein